MNAFITGTDTGVGKTYVTSRLIRDLRTRGVDAVGFKPLCCGSREDAEILREASGNALELNEVNPVWLRAPAAPYAAALIENRSIDLALIREVFARLHARHASVLVEGVGGWQVPILKDYTVADFARECALPVIVVVANRLGALNHTALTVGSIRACGLVCAGIILNNGVPDNLTIEDSELLARTTNRAVLEDWLQVPVISEVEAGQAGLSIPLSEGIICSNSLQCCQIFGRNYTRRTHVLEGKQPRAWPVLNRIPNSPLTSETTPMMLHKIFHMNQSVEETKRRLSDVSSYRHHLDGVERADFDRQGGSNWRLLLPLGFRAEFALTALKGDKANTVMFKSHGGDVEIVGMIAFQSIKPGLTEVDLTINYESSSPLFNVLDRMLNVGDHFLVNQLRRIRAHFEGIAAPTARRETVYGHQFKTVTA